MASTRLQTSLLDTVVELHFGVDLKNKEQLEFAKAAKGNIQFAGMQGTIKSAYITAKDQVYYQVMLPDGLLIDFVKAEDFNLMVSESYGKDMPGGVRMTFKMHHEDAEIVRKALEVGGKMAETDNPARALSLIASDFLAHTTVRYPK